MGAGRSRFRDAAASGGSRVDGEPPAEAVGRSERGWVVAVAMLLVAAAAAPIVSGYLHQRPGERFIGWMPAYFEDYMSLLAWLRQAEQGHLLFRDLFTSEPHQRVILLPLFWVMGFLARFTSTSPLVVWYIVHLLAIVLLVVALHRFAAAFCRDRATRLLAVGLAATAAGIGPWMHADWLASLPESQRPIGLWLVEANQFFPVAACYFVLPLALALMLLALVRLLRYLEEGRLADAGAAAGWALALAVTHLYDVVTLLAVACAWAIALRSRRWRGLALFAAVPAPFVLYSLVVVKTDPVLSQLTWEMAVPSVTAHVLGWGIPLALAVAAAVSPGVWREHRRTGLLVGWLLTVVILLLLPIEFRRKLIWGAQVPMTVLAAMFARLSWTRLASRIRMAPRRKALAWAASAALLSACAFGSLYTERDLLRRAAEHDDDAFLPAGQVAALDWLRERVRSGDVVLASPAIAPLIPAWTGATVFCGHWAQTVDLGSKWHFVEELFRSPGFLPTSRLRAMLARNRVRFVVLDARSMAKERLPEALPEANVGRLARLVLRNETVAIWEMETPITAREDDPWPSGTWKGP